MITLEVPSDWEYDGSNWDSTWTINGKAYDFTAQTLTASPDLNAYDNGWDTKGIFIATSQDWGKMGGYANLLEGVESFYTECTPKTAQSYKDNTYEGQMVLYTKCGPNKANAIVMALRPVKNPTAYLVLFEMKYTTQADLDELDAIVSTADVNP